MVKNKEGKCLKLQKERGYIRCNFYFKGKVYHRSIHRLVGESFLSVVSDKKEINHKDGDKSNNHYTNLEWVDRSGNMKHAYRTGLICHKGENHNLSFLTKEIVRNIRFLARYIKQKDICIQYGLNPQHVSNIVNKHIWKNE